MYSLLRPWLFALPPEAAHAAAMALLEGATALPFAGTALRRWQGAAAAPLARRLGGLTFPNPVGLAAGFDKDGRYIEALSCLGFGFIEVGTVTPRPQSGNPRPRLFRLPADEGLINRMGFNNQGVQALADRLQRWRERRHGTPHPIVGANIGKNKDTPNDRAAEDYHYCFERLFPWVDYFVVNISSPNTPGLRDLQAREPLLRLLASLQEANQRQQRPKPLLLKIAPDLSFEQLDEIADIIRATELSGLVATNTTVCREGLRTPAARLQAIGPGGLSGAPLRQRATQVLRHLRQRLGSEMLLIGVGGIDSAEAAEERWQVGADLIQVYTGLIYKGPALVRQILACLAAKT